MFGRRESLSPGSKWTWGTRPYDNCTNVFTVRKNLNLTGEQEDESNKIRNYGCRAHRERGAFGTSGCPAVGPFAWYQVAH